MILKETRNGLFKKKDRLLTWRGLNTNMVVYKILYNYL